MHFLKSFFKFEEKLHKTGYVQTEVHSMYNGREIYSSGLEYRPGTRLTCPPW